MRASLRTLLAYEDTAFDVPARREVDHAVSSGDVTSTLLEKIRRVRSDVCLDAPATHSNSELDPNITAEYLDHMLIESEIAPLESLCMTSDAVLAEVAACHEIVSKRLGNEIHVDHLGRLRCYAVVGMSPLPSVADTQEASEPVPINCNRGGDVAACLREGKAKNRRLIWMAAASIAIFIVGIVLSQRPATMVRVESRHDVPLPDAPSSLDSFVFDDVPPPPPVVLKATLVESPSSHVAPAALHAIETLEDSPILVAAVSEMSPWSIPIPTDTTNLNVDTTGDATPTLDESDEALPAPPSRRVNPLRPDITTPPLVPAETETPESAVADSPPVPPLRDLPAVTDAAAKTVAWESQQINEDFLDAKELPATIDSLDTQDASEPELKTEAETQLPAPSMTRLALGKAGNTTIPHFVTFASESRTAPRRDSGLIHPVSASVTAVPAIEKHGVATIDPVGSSLAFLATTPDTPWRAVTTNDECPSGGYILTVAPFQASLSLRGGGNVRLIGDCKVSLIRTKSTVTLIIDYGRCVITLPPNATEPVTLRIQTEQGGGFVTLPPGKGIVFVDTFAQRGTISSPPPNAIHNTETLRQYCEMVRPRTITPRDIALGFLPEPDQSGRGETVFLWRSDVTQSSVTVRQPIAVMLGHDATVGYATSVPPWLTSPVAPNGARLIAAWSEACSAAGDGELGTTIGILETHRSPEVRSLALRLWGDLGSFAAPLKAFAASEGDDAVRAVMSVYFREVLRRDSETIVRLNDAVNEW